MSRGLARVSLALLVTGTALTGCTGSTVGSDPRSAGSPAADVIVASFDFPESHILAELYAQTLEVSGLTVQRELNLGSRELVMPALIRGLVDLVPEYSGSALGFLTGSTDLATPDGRATSKLLARELKRRALVALDPAPAQDQNAFAVTRATAEHLGLRSIGDLTDHAPDFTIGGPPECPERPLCLAGLERAYGLRFEEFLPLAAAGQVAAALAQGTIDVGVLFSTDGAIADQDFIALDDDLGLQPAENVTPVMRVEALDRIGPSARERLDDVSAALSTTDLRALNARVAFERVSPAEAAGEWLVGNGLPIPQGAE